MSKRNNILLVEDMLEACKKIERYTSEHSLESFMNDEKTIDAVVRNFEIIGEAANKIEDEFKSKYPKIEWNRLRGFRNRIVHEYFGIDNEIVWSICQNYLTKLKVRLEYILVS